MNRRHTIANCPARQRCAEDRRRSVQRFLDNPMLLEAAMVRCAQDRSESSTTPNASTRARHCPIQAKEEAERRGESEFESHSARASAKRRELPRPKRSRRAAEEARASSRSSWPSNELLPRSPVAETSRATRPPTSRRFATSRGSPKSTPVAIRYEADQCRTCARTARAAMPGSLELTRRRIEAHTGAAINLVDSHAGRRNERRHSPRAKRAARCG